MYQGKEFKAWLKKSQISAQNAADILGLKSRQTVYQYYETKSLSRETVSNILSAFKVAENEIWPESHGLLYGASDILPERQNTNQKESNSNVTSHNNDNYINRLAIKPDLNHLQPINESGKLKSLTAKTMLITDQNNLQIEGLSLIVPPKPAIPLYTQSFYAIEDNKPLYLSPSGYTSMDIYHGCDCVVINHGEAMAPKIGDGYLMGLKQIDKTKFFPQSNIYTIITSGFDITRYVHKSPNGDRFKLTCANESYPSEEIHIDEILAMWHVKVWVPFGKPNYS